MGEEEEIKSGIDRSESLLLRCFSGSTRAPEKERYCRPDAGIMDSLSRRGARETLDLVHAMRGKVVCSL